MAALPQPTVTIAREEWQPEALMAVAAGILGGEAKHENALNTSWYFDAVGNAVVFAAVCRGVGWDTGAVVHAGSRFLLVAGPL